MPRVLQHAPVIRRSAHQHLPRSPSTAVMPARTARTGGESATCTSHAAMRRKTAYTCQYLVHNAGMRLRSAHCRRSIQTSRRRIRSSLLNAAQVMRRCKMVAARSAHSCARVHAHAPSSHASVSALCECAGCARVSHMWTLRVPHAGHHVMDPTPGWDPMRGGILRAALPVH